MMGEDLVAEVLQYSVPEYKDKFFVVAYNPFARYGMLLPLYSDYKGVLLGFVLPFVRSVRAIRRVSNLESMKSGREVWVCDSVHLVAFTCT